MIIGHLLFIYASSGLLLADGALQHLVLVTAAGSCGLSFGAIWPHLVVLVSELFGSDNLASNYMAFDGGCAALGTIVLANYIPSLW